MMVRLYSQETGGLRFGGKFNDAGYAICVTDEGGYLLAGATRTNVDMSSDIYIINLNKYGNTLWEKVYGDEHFDAARSVIPVAGGYVIAGDQWGHGYGRLDTYLMKTDKTGLKVWENHFGTKSRENGFKVKLCKDCGFLVMGYSRGFQNWGSGDFFVIRTDSEGNEIWQNNYGGNLDDYGMDLIENDDGSIFMIGTRAGFFNDVQANYMVHDADILLIKTDNNGNELWQKTFGNTGHDFGYAILKAQDGLFILGSTQSYGNGSFDMFLIKTDLQGNEQWHKTYGGSDYEYGVSMVKNGQDDLYLFGTTKSFGREGSADYYLIKTDKEGNELWNLTLGGDDIDFGHSLIAGEDNGCMVIGQSKSYGKGGFDIFIVKVNKDGLIEYLLDVSDSLSEDNFVIFPNPVSIRGRIRFKSDVQKPELVLELFTISGRRVRSYLLKQPDYNFNVETLSAGTYIYFIHSPGSSENLFSGKLVVR